MPARRNRIKRKRNNSSLYLPGNVKTRFLRGDGLSYRRRRRRIELADGKGALIFILQIAAVILAAFFIVSSFGISVTVVGNSMESTLYDRDVVLINTVAVDIFSPDRGDVVAFSPQGSKDATLSVKRIIGVPKDKIRIADGAIYINDKQYNETKLTDYVSYEGLAETEITLGEDEYFVLGDNPSNSQDSRYESIGNVKRSDMKGKVWWNISHFGLIY